jgi:hypothetical protein
MSLLFKSALGWVLVSVLFSAQSLATEPGATIELKKISDETSELNDKKFQVLQNYQAEAKACWKNFAVNDCLAKARRSKYQQLVPLEQLEVELNTRRRELKEVDRLERLNEKSKAEIAPRPNTKAAP